MEFKSLVVLAFAPLLLVVFFGMGIEAEAVFKGSKVHNDGARFGGCESFPGGADSVQLLNVPQQGEKCLLFFNISLSNPNVSCPGTPTHCLSLMMMNAHDVVVEANFTSLGPELWKTYQFCNTSCTNCHPDCPGQRSTTTTVYYDYDELARN